MSESEFVSTEDKIDIVSQKLTVLYRNKYEYDLNLDAARKAENDEQSETIVKIIADHQASIDVHEKELENLRALQEKEPGHDHGTDD
jgi:hypothetical protein